MSRPWLLTAFEPFAGGAKNSSQQLLNSLDMRRLPIQCEIFLDVPVIFDRAWASVQEVLYQRDFAGVLAFGQSAGRDGMSLECVALNWLDTQTADNSGEIRRGVKIAPRGPDLLWSKVSWQTFEESEDVKRSYSAGTFVCNQLFYNLLQWCETTGKSGGFVHVPALHRSQDLERFRIATIFILEHLKKVRP